MLEYQGLKLNSTKLINPLISFHIKILSYPIFNLWIYEITPVFWWLLRVRKWDWENGYNRFSDHPFGMLFFATALIIVRSKCFFLTCSFWFLVPRYKVATNFVHPPNHITSLLLVSKGSLSLSVCVLFLGTPPFLFPFLFFLVFLFFLLGYFFRLYGLCSFFFFSFGSSAKSHRSMPSECKVEFIWGYILCFCFGAPVFCADLCF